MKPVKVPRKYLYGTAVCAAVGAVILFPGSIVMLVIGAALGFQGRAWLNKVLDKEAMQ